MPEPQPVQSSARPTKPWLEGGRRFLVCWLMSFSFGGFLLYAGAVVPLGSQLVGETTQGFVTQRVTVVLNVAVLVTCLGLVWDVWTNWSRRSPTATRWLMTLTGIIALCCGILWTLHPLMDRLLDSQELSVNQPVRFYRMHRIYLWVSAIQWASSLPALWILVNYSSSSSDSLTGSSDS